MARSAHSSAAALQLASPANGALRQGEPEPAAAGLSSFEREQVFAVAGKRLDEYLSLQPKVLQDEEPKAIHDLRVASRRLQEILGLLYPRPRPARVRKVCRTLRRSRRVLSKVRNCDVVLQRIGEILASRRRFRREPWETVRDYLSECRQELFRQAARKLGRLNMSALYVRTKEELRSLSSAAGTGNERPPSLSQQIAASLQEAWAELESRVAESHEQRSAAAMHAVRLASKRLRYRMEVIAELGASGGGAAVAHLKRLQEKLGDWNDREVMERMMLEMVGRPEYLQEHLGLAMQIERLVLRQRRGKQNRQQRLLALFGEAAEYRRLGGWVDHFLSASPPAAAGV